MKLCEKFMKTDIKHCGDRNGGLIIIIKITEYLMCLINHCINYNQYKSLAGLVRVCLFGEEKYI
jgi:hypothetical protein